MLLYSNQPVDHYWAKLLKLDNFKSSRLVLGKGLKVM